METPVSEAKDMKVVVMDDDDLGVRVEFLSKDKRILENVVKNNKAANESLQMEVGSLKLQVGSLVQHIERVEVLLERQRIDNYTKDALTILFEILKRLPVVAAQKYNIKQALKLSAKERIKYFTFWKDEATVNTLTGEQKLPMADLKDFDLLKTVIGDAFGSLEQYDTLTSSLARQRTFSAHRVDAKYRNVTNLKNLLVMAGTNSVNPVFERGSALIDLFVALGGSLNDKTMNNLYKQ